MFKCQCHRRKPNPKPPAWGEEFSPRVSSWSNSRTEQATLKGKNIRLTTSRATASKQDTISDASVGVIYIHISHAI